MPQTQSYVIEVEDEAVGLVVPENDGVTFHAVHPRTVPLEGRRFADEAEARSAARHALRRAA
ncbi:MAG TPA: hypothetical protein VEB20_12800 [Azospirillaceae bacterium]|nr:hypothetical protein [Azospirillaceae bacterium]